ncbi:hypothetical protein HPB50_006808 [Hyalomma asiaticum]|uniref:Uncharacterized protein n=1 Tax=Hyalomma asiaticum TaxID=266040 RepID=A0ACB7S4H7_HYAAI|nr:hypothetical protein HPB50_006808 [Hyalomma asiaticum]
MQIFRAELTPHPRGSLSAPALSEYYWMPPVSLTCTAVSQVPDQGPVSASTASLLSRAGSQSSATALCHPIVDTQSHGGESTGPTDTSFLRRPFAKSLQPCALKRAFLAAALVAGTVAALLTSDHLLQRRGFAEESRFTEPALRPLVDEPPSKPRGSHRGYETGGQPFTGIANDHSMHTPRSSSSSGSF